METLARVLGKLFGFIFGLAFGLTIWLLSAAAIVLIFKFVF